MGLLPRVAVVYIICIFDEIKGHMEGIWEKK
jgi:hypothetical protein